MKKKQSTKDRLAKLAAKPHSDTVRPLGTTRRGKKETATDKESGTNPEPTTIERTPEIVQNDLAPTDAPVVDSTQSPSATSENAGVTDTPRKDRTMTKTLTFDKISKSGKFAIYKGLRTTTRLALTDFPDQKPIPSFEVTGDFAGPRETKPKMTAEERKAYRLANPKPKPTLAELIAKREKALAALKAKAEAQPELVAQ